MPAYLLIGTVSAVIPPQFLTEALDDDADGVADEGLFATILAAAQTKIDGILGQRFATPFENPIPSIVADSCLTLVCATLYRRRSVADDKNPFAKAEKEALEKLQTIADGKSPLTPELARVKPSAVAITTKSKTNSSRNAI